MTQKEIEAALAAGEGVRITTDGEFQQYVRSLLDRDNYLYRNGNALTAPEFLQSAYSDEARRQTGEALAASAEDKGALRASLNETYAGTGYRDYALKESARAYRDEVQRAARTLAEAYPDFYEDLPISARATTDQRLKIISYIVSYDLTDDESMIYALASGLSYDEALEIAGNASRLRDTINSRFEYYKFYTK